MLIINDPYHQTTVYNYKIIIYSLDDILELIIEIRGMVELISAL